MADAATYAEAVNEGLANEGLAPRYTQQEIELIEVENIQSYSLM